MGVIVRQSIATTIIAYIGVIIGYVNLLYLYPRFLTPDQVGLMRTVQDAAILMAQFAQFGLAQSIIRYFPRFTGHLQDGKNFINLILLAGMVAFGFFLVIFFAFEQPILGEGARKGKIKGPARGRSQGLVCTWVCTARAKIRRVPHSHEQPRRCLRCGVPPSIGFAVLLHRRSDEGTSPRTLWGWGGNFSRSLR